MQAILGAVAIFFGLVGWVGQTISAISFKTAQRVGLQEADADTDPLYRDAERRTAAWDIVVLWPLIAAGVLMVIPHPCWPVAALIAGAIYLDAGGRELAKIMALRRAGVRTGAVSEQRKAVVFLCVLSVVGLAVLIAGLLAWADGCLGS